MSMDRIFSWQDGHLFVRLEFAGHLFRVLDAGHDEFDFDHSVVTRHVAFELPSGIHLLFLERPFEWSDGDWLVEDILMVRELDY